MPQSKKPRRRYRGTNAGHQHDWSRLANRRDPKTHDPLYGCASCPATTTEPNPQFGRLNVAPPESVARMLARLNP